MSEKVLIKSNLLIVSGSVPEPKNVLPAHLCGEKIEKEDLRIEGEYIASKTGALCPDSTYLQSIDVQNLHILFLKFY